MSLVKVAGLSNLEGTKSLTTDQIIDRATCRAWVNFNGTDTVVIRASFNVSSITDNGPGNYTVNFTTAMPDTNYCVVIGARQDGDTNEHAYQPDIKYGGTYSVSAVQVGYGYSVSSSVWRDPSYFNVAVFR